MFFPNETLNEKDPLFLELRSRYKLAGKSESNADVVIAKSLPSTKEIAADELLLGWDIILRNV
jgi:hypothetical protein